MIDFFYEYTEDHLRLQGTYFDSGKKDCCLIFIHGQAQSILDNSFAYIWGKYLSNHGISFLYGHNRGYSYINCMTKEDGNLEMVGSTFENFQDSIKDIKLWVLKAKSLGYKKIILMGHSLGCNKVLYYLSENPGIDGVIFASAPDLVGLAKKAENSHYAEMMREAKENLKNKEPKKILSTLLDGTDYVASENFVNTYSEEGKNDNFPITRNPAVFQELSNLTMPILSFAGSLEDSLFLKQELLKEKAINCHNFEYQIIENTNHFYQNKEAKIAELILKWLQENILN